MGQSPPGTTYNKAGVGVPLINGPVEFTEGPFGKTVVNQYTTKPTMMCEEGDLLLCVRGSTTGRTNIAAFRACIGRGVAAIRPLLAGRYVHLFIWRLRASIIAMGRGIAFPSVSRAQIEALPVPLPPLAEQHRIVAKVDELMALCDRLEAAQTDRDARRDRLASASLHHLNNGANPEAFRGHAHFYINHLPRLTTRPEQIKQLRQTILNLAVRGKLVSHNQYANPAALSVKTPKSASQTAKPDLDSFLSQFGLPPMWVRTTLESVSEIASGVAKGKDLRGYKTTTYPYLRVANVQRGFLDLSLVKDLEIRIDEFSRYELRKGDVLMTEGGDWDKLGRAAVWEAQIPKCIHQNHVFRVRPLDPALVSPQWIVVLANSPLGRTYFAEASKQTTNLASINMTQLRSCPVPLPSREEQDRIVAKVDEVMAVCDQLEAQLTKTQTERRRLLEAVLQEALTSAATQTA